MSSHFEEKRRQLFFFIKEYGKTLALLAFLLLTLLELLFLSSNFLPKKMLVTFFDIGQGDAIFIETPSGHQMLIDGGPTNRVLELLSKRMSYLDHDIDVVLETHPDADHVTGLIPVLDRYTVSEIVTSVAKSDTDIFGDLLRHIDDEHAEVHVARRGDVIDFHDGAVVTVLYPDTGYIPKKGDTNDASVSVVLTYGEESFLLTGDLPTTEESKLIQDVLSRHVTVYKAGHHGSKYSSGEQLLSYIRPEYSIISAGKGNKYGHPNPEAMTRLEKYSKEILSTIERGSITFMTDGRLLSVEYERSKVGN